MKAKRILTLLLASILLLTSLTACGNKQPQIINPNGEIEVSEEPNSAPKEEHLPTYDYKNLEPSNKLEGKEIEVSYYASKLNERNLISYNEIYEAAMTFQAEVVLSKKISPTALMQIMNIIYLDTPELYMLENIYEYDTESNGNVHKVYLKYNMTPETYIVFNEQFLKKTLSDINSLKQGKTEFEVENKIVEKLNSKMFNNSSSNAIEEFYSSSPLSSIFTIVRSSKGNHLAFAKLFNYYCRKTGLESAVVIGELTNTDYAKQIGLNIGTYKPLTEAIKQTIDGTHVKVNIDYSCFYAWNIIKLNNQWYHVDVLFPELWHQSTEGIKDYDISINTTINVDDYTISQSRLFHVNEDLLGLIPECNQKTFQSLYRSGNYFLNYNANQIVVVVNSKLDEFVRNKTKMAYYQFDSEEVYDIFISSFDEIVEAYNENNANVIQNYSIIENKETLSIVIYKLLYFN